MKKQTKKQLDDFNNKVIDMLEFYGATRIEEASTDFITYSINSEKIGRLTISLDNEICTTYAIYTQFDDVNKARDYFNASLNGRYNSHEYSPEPCLSFIYSLLSKYVEVNKDKLNTKENI